MGCGPQFEVNKLLPPQAGDLAVLRSGYGESLTRAQSDNHIAKHTALPHYHPATLEARGRDGGVGVGWGGVGVGGAGLTITDNQWRVGVESDLAEARNKPSTSTVDRYNCDRRQRGILIGMTVGSQGANWEREGGGDWAGVVVVVVVVEWH